MVKESEANYLFQRISRLEDFDGYEDFKTDLIAIYEECTDIHTNNKRDLSDILTDFYTSGYEMGGNVITLYSFVDEIRSINRKFERFVDDEE